MIDSPLAIVSNRQPYRHEFSDGGIAVDRPGGGLVAGLDTVARTLDARWIAWGDGEADAVVADDRGRLEVPPDDPHYTLERIWLEPEDVTGYYEGYANRVLWPLCHCRTGPYRYKPHYWERYRAVNRQFADRVLSSTDPDATVWFQDYHLATAPGMVREEHDGQLVHFWHIPWPSDDVLRFCPQRTELLQGLLGNDVLGFHIDRFGAHFMDCVEEFLPEATVDREKLEVSYAGHVTRIGSYPLGVDVEQIQSTARGATDAEDTLREQYGIAGSIVLGVDRLDYTKGIPERLRALEYLLEHAPGWRGRFTYVQKCISSREGIPEYRQLREDVDDHIDRINRRFGTDTWDPVVGIDDFLPAETLYGLYRSADVLLVTPICDGMNLVAQEYVAAQLDNDGALVLSEFAGVHEFLGADALSVNPFDIPQHAQAIERGLHMSAQERRTRMRSLRRAVNDLDITEWPASVLTTTSPVDPGVSFP